MGAAQCRQRPLEPKPIPKGGVAAEMLVVSYLGLFSLKTAPDMEET
jgi:hypothetical protein